MPMGTEKSIRRQKLCRQKGLWFLPADSGARIKGERSMLDLEQSFGMVKPEQCDISISPH